MKQPGVLLILITFVAAVSFVVASEQYKNGSTKTVTLTGLNEVGGFGDPDGAGIFKYSADANESRLCYELTFSNIDNVSGVVIGFGSKDVSGSVIMKLETLPTEKSEGCFPLDGNRIADLTKNPENYFVNVLSSEFPNGAIRGQLSR